MCSGEWVKSLTADIGSRRLRPFSFLILMEAASGYPEARHRLTRHTLRLVKLGREILKRSHKDPDKNPHGCQKLTKRDPGSASSQLMDVWEQTVFAEEGGGDHRVQVDYVRSTEVSSGKKTDTLTLELTKMADGLRLACGTVLRKLYGQPDETFEMTGMSLLSAPVRTNFDFSGETLQNSEIVAAMERVLLEIVRLLERDIVGHERHAGILGSIRRLLQES